MKRTILRFSKKSHRKTIFIDLRKASFKSISVITMLLILTISCKKEDLSGTITTYNVNGVSFDMVFVQGGTFTMGCTDWCSSWDRSALKIKLRSFQIGKYEVTQKLWNAIMDDNPSVFIGDNLPVHKVCWTDAQEFIRRLNLATGKNYRLPTEAEWEYAARGGNRTQGYTFSGSNDIFQVAWFYDNSESTPHPVGTKLSNELGIYDMSGNVEEWCFDWLREFPDIQQFNPIGDIAGLYRAVRGGNFVQTFISCVIGKDGGALPTYDNGFELGFRLVLPEPR